MLTLDPQSMQCSLCTQGGHAELVGSALLWFRADPECVGHGLSLCSGHSGLYVRFAADNHPWGEPTSKYLEVWPKFWSSGEIDKTLACDGYCLTKFQTIPT